MRSTTPSLRMRAARLAGCLTLAAMLAFQPGTAQAQGPASPSESGKAESRSGFAIFGGSASSARDSIVALARQQLGRRYVLGGQNPDKGFDCSGLIRYILAKLDIEMPRTSARQAFAGRSVPKDTSMLRPGDLVTFGNGKRISHIGIYVGDGRFIHASSGAGRVIESELLRAPAPRIKPWKGARRVVLADTASAGDEG